MLKPLEVVRFFNIPLTLAQMVTVTSLHFLLNRLNLQKLRLLVRPVIKKRKSKKRHKKIQQVLKNFQTYRADKLPDIVQKKVPELFQLPLPRELTKEIKLLTQKNLGKKLMMLIGKHLGQVRNIYQYKKKLDPHQN